MNSIYPELIAVDVQAETSEEAIRKVGQIFLDNGFVKDTYIDAVVAREKVYPTGLQLADMGVAMPHTDPPHVYKSGVCVAKLAKPVTFIHMGTEDQPVEAEMLFMMAITDPSQHLETLSKVMNVFQKPEIGKEIRKMKTCRILCVCGSGTVSSNMVANKLRDQLGEAGWDCTTVETSPGGVETELMGNKYDIIACVSPVYQDYDIPKVNAVGMLTGMAEKQVIEDCLKILEG